jgi:hypothetical protein
MTRAARLLLRCAFIEAWKMHPMVYALPPLCFVFAVDALVYVKTGVRGTLSEHPWALRAGLVLLVLLIGVWVARFLGYFGGPVPV